MFKKSSDFLVFSQQYHKNNKWVKIQNSGVFCRKNSIIVMGQSTRSLEP